MPAKVDKMKLNEKQDRRRKLSNKQKEEIRDLYSTGNYSLRILAKMYEVSKTTILYIVNEESNNKLKEYKKENWKQWQKTKDERAIIMRELRNYKRELCAKGELS